MTTILLVDDHPPNLMALEAILEPLGHRLLSASSGAEAVEIAARTHEDLALVLLDLQMPELDGLETAALIKKNDRCRHVPIIIVTANEPTHAELARGYATGAVDFLFKPLDPDVLRSKVAVFVQLFERRDRDHHHSAPPHPHSHSHQKEEGSGRLSERLMAAAPASADQAATVEALFRIHEALSEDLDVANLAQRLVFEATELTNAAGAALLYTTAQGGAGGGGARGAGGAGGGGHGGESRAAFAGAAKDLLLGRNVPPPATLSAKELTKLGPVGALLDPVFDARKVVRHDDVHRASGMHGGRVGSVVAVPIWARASGEVKGALILVHEAVYAFDARDEELAIVAATHASSALENARLYEQTREAVHRAELAELELRASEARLRIALDAAGLGTWDYNPSNDTLRWDGRCRALAGLNPESEVDYQLFLHGIHPEDRARVNQAVRSALDPSTDMTFDVEYRAIGVDDGIERWIAARGQGIAEQGRPVRFIGAMLDVTAKKTEEVERAELLAAEQRARESAESASRAKDEFLATVSHELRNPLNAILGWSRVLMEERSAATAAQSTLTPADAERTRKGLDVILRNAKAQVQLVEDILEVSRIVTGKLRLATRAIDLAATIDIALESVRAGAQAKGVVLKSEIDRAIAELTIVADEDRVQQILWNLLSNAVKFTPSNGRVSLVARLPQGQNAVELVVQDSGEGIDPEFLPFVFDRFRQFDGSTTRLHGGLGLGLAIVRHLAELHGGRVAAFSEGRGKGATFVVALPIARRAALDTEGERELESTPSVRERRLSPQQTRLLAGRTIVVLDDDADMRDLIRMILEDAGATVSAHGDVQSAIDVLEGRGGSRQQRQQYEQVDVAVSDLAMPGEDGYAFARRVRSSAVEAARCVPLVAMTAYARAEDRRRVLSAGFDRHVAKPIEPDELVEALAAVIAGK